MKESEIKKLLHQLRKQNCQESKNKLMQEYYSEAVAWTKKHISKSIYTDLLNPSDEEIISMVFQAFETTIKRIDLEKSTHLSFKNFLYLMIKYQFYKELKTVFNYRVISNFDYEKQKIKEERKQYQYEEQKYLYKEDINRKIEIIISFLKTRNELYAKIFELKKDGYSNEEISKKMNTSESSVKSKLQYIRKLVLMRYQTFDNIY